MGGWRPVEKDITSVLCDLQTSHALTLSQERVEVRLRVEQRYEIKKNRKKGRDPSDDKKS